MKKLLFLILLLLIPAVIAVQLDNPKLPRVETEVTAITFDNNTGYVNRSDYWDNLDTPNDFFDIVVSNVARLGILTISTNAITSDNNIVTFGTDSISLGGKFIGKDINISEDKISSSTGLINFTDENLYTTKNIYLMNDSQNLYLGASSDFGLYSDGSRTVLNRYTNGHTEFRIQDEDDGVTSVTYISFWDVNDRHGYLGMGSTSNSNMIVRAENGDLELESLYNDIVISSGTGAGDIVIIDTEFVNVTNDLNVVKNFTGNQIYGSITGDEIGTITIGFSGIYYNVTNTSVGFVNGFIFNDSGLGGLTAQVAGKYSVNSGWSFNGGANTEYHLRVQKNGLQADNCHAQRKIGTGADVGSASTAPCIVELVIGDVLNLGIENVDNINNAEIHDVGMVAVRVGD